MLNDIIRDISEKKVDCGMEFPNTFPQFKTIFIDYDIRPAPVMTDHSTAEATTVRISVKNKKEITPHQTALRSLFIYTAGSCYRLNTLVKNEIYPGYNS